MRLTLDTNVVFQALNSDLGASHKILTLAQQGVVQICLTNTLFNEYRDVLLRKKNLRLFNLSSKDVSLFLDALVSLADHSKVYYLIRPNLIDENDNMVIECAVASQSQYLITANIKDFSQADLQPYDFTSLTPSKFMKAWRIINE